MYPIVCCHDAAFNLLLDLKHEVLILVRAMSVFDVDFSSGGLPKYMTPVRLRQPKMMAWLQILVQPVNYLYGLFSGHRAANLYELAHSSQVCYLQAVLNDVFDPVSRGIFVSDGPYVDPSFIYKVIEDRPLFIDLAGEVGTSVIPAPDPVPLYTVMETYLLGVQFVVNVPAGVAASPSYDVHRLRAMTDKYRLVSKNNYVVVTY